MTWILNVTKKIDSAFALWGGRQYVAAVDLLDMNRNILKKSDWPYCVRYSV